MMQIKISVRSLVEFLLRSGDIDDRSTTGMQAEAMRLGSKMHRKLQKKAGPSYHAEVPLKMEFQEEHYTIVLEGRADGIIETEKQKEQDLQEQADSPVQEVIVDEIKGVFFDIDKMKEPKEIH